MATQARQASLKRTAATKKVKSVAAKTRRRSAQKRPTLKDFNRLMTENYAAFAADAIQNTIALTGKTRF